MAECAGCGLDRSKLAPAEAIALLSSLPDEYASVVAQVPEGMRMCRPSDGVWSVTEYVAHTADALTFIRRRAELLLAEDDPVLPRFGNPDDRDYSAVTSQRAVDQVSQAIRELVEALEGVEPDGWARIGHNELGSGTLRDTAAYGAHEAVHHLHDVRNVAAQVTTRHAG